MRTGTITRAELALGFGFIRDAYGVDWFFVTGGVADPDVREGARVEFAEERTPTGPRATGIRRVTS